MVKATTWATNIAAYTGLAVNEVRLVNPSDSASTRVYLINPSFTPGSPSGNPIWTQTSTGAVSVSGATLLILSTHKSSLTLPVSNGVASSTCSIVARHRELERGYRQGAWKHRLWSKNLITWFWKRSATLLVCVPA